MHLLFSAYFILCAGDDQAATDGFAFLRIDLHFDQLSFARTGRLIVKQVITFEVPDGFHYRLQVLP